MSPAGPVGYFLIDSLDSLLLTGLTDEYRRARDWVEKLSFDLDDKFHTFEVKLVPVILTPGKRRIDVSPPWSYTDHDPRPRGVALGVPLLWRERSDAPRQGRRSRRPLASSVRDGAPVFLSSPRSRAPFARREGGIECHLNVDNRRS
jgi:hypothetical protein